MKNNFTLLSGLLFMTGVTFAQQTNLSNLNQYEAHSSVHEDIKTNLKPNGNYTAKAEGTELWSSDFSDASLWTIGTTGQGTFEIGTYPAQLTQYMGAYNLAGASVTNGVGFFNGVQYLIPSPGTAAPQNTWMQTEAIDFSGNAHAEISFNQRYRKFNTDSTYVEFSGDGGTNWTTIRVNKNVGTSGLQEKVTMVFPVGNATAGVFRFRWQNTSSATSTGSGYGWAIDDVSIKTLSDFDLARVDSDYSVVGYQYSRVPTAQVAPMDFWSLVKNQGSTTLTGVKLALDVNGTLGTVESSALSLASIAADTLKASYNLPATVGNYSIAQRLLLDQADDNLANNTLPSYEVEVTDYIYSIDKGTTYTEYPLTSLSVGGVPVVIDGVGMSFDTYADQVLYGIDFRLFAGTTLGAQVYGEIYEYNPEAATIQTYWKTPYVAESDMFTVNEESQIGTIQTSLFSNPPTLTAGKTYLLILKFASGAGTIKMSAAGTTSKSQSWLHGDHANIWGTFTTAPVVRANFNPSLSVKTADLVNGVTLFPNPATEKVAVDFNLTAVSDVVVEIADINGKVMESKTLNNVTIGTNKVELNVNNYAAGLYTVAIKSNNTNVTKKLIVQ